MYELPVRHSRPRKLSACWLIIGNLVVVAILVSAAIRTLNHSRQAEEENARRSADNLALSISIELSAELRLIDNALLTIASEYARHDTTQAARQAVAPLTREQHRMLPDVSSIGFADPFGQVDPPRDGKVSAFSIADRDYFARARDSDAMVISEPLRGRLDDEWCIVLARRLSTPAGEFAGVVGATLTSARLTEKLVDLDLGPSGAIVIRSEQLRLIARHLAASPGAKAGLGGTQVPATLRQQLAQNPERGWFIGATPLDQVTRVSAYRRIPGYPMMVLAGIATDDYLAEWRREVRRHVALTLIIVILIAGISWASFRRQVRERYARMAAMTLAREQSLMLENDLIGMMRFKDRVATWDNKAAAKILGYAPGELRGQPARRLYPNDDAYDYVGRVGYRTLLATGSFRAQVQLIRRCGDPIWIDLSGTMVSEDESLWMLVDIEDIKRNEAKAYDLALRDSLTGLPNRRLFDEKFADLLAHARRTGSGVAVCYLDLDLFKPINDQHGHEAGDAVLKAVGQSLQSGIRSLDLVARLGGDEFALILSEFLRAEDVIPVLERIVGRIREPVRLDNGQWVSVDVSVGVVWDDGTSAPQLLKLRADEAMYAAKRAGSGSIHLFADHAEEAIG